MVKSLRRSINEVTPLKKRWREGEEPFTQTKGFIRSFEIYWLAYGGWRAVAFSPYLLLAIVLSAVTVPLWLKPNWWDIVFAVIPCVLGFSIGGFAIFLAFGDDGFRTLISGKHKNDKQGQASPYIEFSASFFHFILLQVLATFFAICAKSFYIIKLNPASILSHINDIFRWLWWFVGFATFCYALCLVIAVAMAIFSLSETFECYLEEKKRRELDADSEV